MGTGKRMRKMKSAPQSRRDAKGPVVFVLNPRAFPDYGLFATRMDRLASKLDTAIVLRFWDDPWSDRWATARRWTQLVQHEGVPEESAVERCSIVVAFRGGKRDKRAERIMGMAEDSGKRVRIVAVHRSEEK